MTANAIRRSSWDLTLVLALSLMLMVVVPLLYAFSVGPTFWLTKNVSGEPPLIWAVAYFPLFMVVHGTFLEPYLTYYLKVWGMNM